jgi:2-dehydropantoate 2-reductase
MRVVVLGAGAMGCLFGGLLRKSGHEVTFIDVSAEQINAINASGLHIERSDGTIQVSVRAAYANEITTPPDLLIVFTKSFHTRSALESVRQLLGYSTTILTLQNGLGNSDLIAEFVAHSQIVEGVTTVPCDLIAPGRIRSMGVGHTRINSADGASSSRLDELRDAIQNAGLHCEIDPGVFQAIWEKVAFNSALNSLTAISGLTVGGVGGAPEGRELARRIVLEISAVARAAGVPVQEQRVFDTVDFAFREHQDHMPSMLQDIRAGRKTEIDSLNLEVARWGQKLGVSTPLTETLGKLVRMKERSYL